MNPETRPNIVTVGILMGAVVQMICFTWNALSPVDLGAGEAAALTTILTAIAQWFDRASKRADHHVLNKHGPSDLLDDQP